MAQMQQQKQQRQEEEGPPPYAYQEQPLQMQQSSDYAPYPKFHEEELHQKQQQVQRQERWGTPAQMGAPSNPSAHPDNQHAAAGGFTAHDPYVQPTSSISSSDSTDSEKKGEGGGLSMDAITAQVAEFSKRAGTLLSNLWGHLTTGSSVADTAWGRMNAGTKLLTQGGFEGVFRASFPFDANEGLKKTYACFLSTSTGPVAGTLFISSKNLAFCSDRPLAYTPAGEEQSCYSYYKVIIPLDKIREVDPSVNPTKPAEKYIRIITHDDCEFWFMGFINYDKGVKNVKAALASKQ